MYAQQVMRPNETYMYMGYAARSAMALGINRGTVVNRAGLDTHHIQVTFWMTYALERITALIVGRPSAFRDDQIDAPYPPDESAEYSILNQQVTQKDLPFVRTMARIGKLADDILTGIYTSEETLSITSQYLIENNIVKYESALEKLTQHLPVYLNFLDGELPIGEDWQETQRLHTGLLFYTLRLLLHRPVLLFTTNFSCNLEAQAHAPGVIQLQESIIASNTCAKNIIQFAHESLFTRLPVARSDGSLASYLVAACVTLLYEVLDPAITPVYAKETFTAVEKAIKCLDCMKHLGPTTGKALSADIMYMAQNALSSSSGDLGIDQHLMDEFPWLE